MVNYSDASLDRTFAALCDPTRRALLSRLSLGETRVSELAQPFRMSLPAISKHITVLEDAGLVRKRKVGREQLCSLVAGPLGDAEKWLVQYRMFWEAQLEKFAAYVESEFKREESEWRRQKRKQRSGSAGSSKRPDSASSTRGRRPRR